MERGAMARPLCGTAAIVSLLLLLLSSTASSLRLSPSPHSRSPTPPFLLPTADAPHPSSLFLLRNHVGEFFPARPRCMRGGSSDIPHIQPDAAMYMLKARLAPTKAFFKLADPDRTGTVTLAGNHDMPA
jgi:hypothetical protein